MDEIYGQEHLENRIRFVVDGKKMKVETAPDIGPAPPPYNRKICIPPRNATFNTGPAWVAVPEAKVTPEMIAAAIDADRSHIDSNAADWYVTMYRAMYAVAPVEFAPEARIAELEAERDAALKESDLYDKCLGTMEYRVLELKAELTAIRDALAKFTAANVPDTPKPDPIVNAIRARQTDRRRIGS